MEELLNKLIKRGWKPFGDENVKEIKIYSDMDMECIYGKKKSDFYYFSPRKITSKESGLWQFCKENKMLIGFSPRRWTKNAEDCYGLVKGDVEYWGWNYEYRLIESALKDESELEYFLLSNIKIDG